MPPVFGPRSPSKARLWSCAVPSGMAVVPSHRAKKLASSPTRHSSMTSSAPAAPSAPPSMASIGRLGLGDARRDDDALAGGEAVGLDDDRRAPLAHIGLGGVRPRGSARRRRSGCRTRAQSSLVKAFEPSSCAAARRGPNALMPAAARSSTRPATSGASGPTTTRPIASARQKAAIAAWSPGSRATLVPHCAVPGLPGAMKSRSQRGLPEIFQASACSRPPEPMRRMFTGLSRFPARL